MYNENEELFCRTLHGIMSESVVEASDLTYNATLTRSGSGGREYLASLQEEKESDLGSGRLEE